MTTEQGKRKQRRLQLYRVTFRQRSKHPDSLGEEFESTWHVLAPDVETIGHGFRDDQIEKVEQIDRHAFAFLQSVRDMPDYDLKRDVWDDDEETAHIREMLKDIQSKDPDIDPEK